MLYRFPDQTHPVQNGADGSRPRNEAIEIEAINVRTDVSYCGEDVIDTLLRTPRHQNTVTRSRSNA